MTRCSIVLLLVVMAAAARTQVPLFSRSTAEQDAELRAQLNLQLHQGRRPVTSRARNVVLVLAEPSQLKALTTLRRLNPNRAKDIPAISRLRSSGLCTKGPATSQPGPGCAPSSAREGEERPLNCSAPEDPKGHAQSILQKAVLAGKVTGLVSAGPVVRSARYFAAQSLQGDQATARHQEDHRDQGHKDQGHKQPGHKDQHGNQDHNVQGHKNPGDKNPHGNQDHYDQGHKNPGDKNPHGNQGHKVQQDQNKKQKDKKRCDDTAAQLIRGKIGQDLKVILGLGRRQFRGTKALDERCLRGVRGDSADLVEEWRLQKLETKLSHAFVWDEHTLRAQNLPKLKYLLGLFEHAKRHPVKPGKPNPDKKPGKHPDDDDSEESSEEVKPQKIPSGNNPPSHPDQKPDHPNHDKDPSNTPTPPSKKPTTPSHETDSSDEDHDTPDKKPTHKPTPPSDTPTFPSTTPQSNTPAFSSTTPPSKKPTTPSSEPDTSDEDHETSNKPHGTTKPPRQEETTKPPRQDVTTKPQQQQPGLPTNPKPSKPASKPENPKQQGHNRHRRDTYELADSVSSRHSKSSDVSRGAVPRLSEMTEAALTVLSAQGDYVLVIRGDEKADKSAQQLEDAISKVLDLTSEQDTLVIVTAQNPPASLRKCGRESLPSSSSPRQIAYFQRYFHMESPEGREDPEEDEEECGMVFARGPWAHLVSGTFEHRYVELVTDFAACLGDGVNACTRRR